MGVEHEYLQHMSRLDSTELRALMEAYGQAVWDYAYILTRSSHSADDISQDVFLKAYQSIGAFRGQSSVKTWLLTITRNTAYNYRRSAFFRKVLLVGLGNDRQTTQSAENTYMDRAYADDIWDAVMALPGKFREVLVLEAKYGLAMQEIAELLGLSEGTVKSRLYRARKKVAAQLKEANGYESI